MTLVCRIFIIRGLKLEVAKRVASVEPKLVKLSTPIIVEELF